MLCFNCTVLHYIHVSYGIIINNNVLRLLCNELKHCSASYMFVSRGLPTCKMLIRKHVYSLMMCIAKSGNEIFQSIMNDNALYTSTLCHHWRNMLYI